MSGLLLHAFEQTAASLPDKVALISGDERLSYGDLLLRVRTLAHALTHDGVGTGDRVLIFLDNRVEFAIALYGVLAAGAVIVPVSSLAKAEKLAFLVNDARASALLTHTQLASAWQPVLRTWTTLRSCRVAGDSPRLEADLTEDAIDPIGSLVRPWPASLSAGPESEARSTTGHRADGDLAAIIYTSGTTGIAKGVMLTQANIASALTSIQAYLGIGENDVIGLALPTAFSYGLNNLMLGLARGATVVLDRWAAFPIKLAGMLERERVTVFPGVPTLFASLLGLADLSRFDLSRVRLLTNAAAALPQTHLQRLRAAFPQAQLVLMYGMTECVRASYLPPQEVDQRPGSVGRGIARQDHWLVDELGRRLPSGSLGELVVSGPHVMLGYWERPVETREKLKPNPMGGPPVLFTGDVFRSDADGYLYFVSRKDDMIKTRGEKVAPREVESVIYRLDAVTGCAVVGVPDDALGQAVKAFVTLTPDCGLDERAIIRYCLSRLENYMAPKFVEIVDELPRTESGKIRHASLR